MVPGSRLSIYSWDTEGLAAPLLVDKLVSKVETIDVISRLQTAPMIDIISLLERQGTP